MKCTVTGDLLCSTEADPRVQSSDPAVDEVTVVLGNEFSNEDEEISLIIKNIQGNTLSQHILNLNRKSVSIDVKSLVAGLYIVELQSSDRFVRIKLIKN